MRDTLSLPRYQLLLKFTTTGGLGGDQFNQIRTRWKKIARMELEKTPELNSGRFIAAQD